MTKSGIETTTATPTDGKVTGRAYVPYITSFLTCQHGHFSPSALSRLRTLIPALTTLLGCLHSLLLAVLITVVLVVLRQLFKNNLMPSQIPSWWGSFPGFCTFLVFLLIWNFSNSVSMEFLCLYTLQICLKQCVAEKMRRDCGCVQVTELNQPTCGSPNETQGLDETVCDPTNGTLSMLTSDD